MGSHCYTSKIQIVVNQLYFYQKKKKIEETRTSGLDVRVRFLINCLFPQMLKSFHLV